MIRKWTTTLLFQPKDLQLHCHVIRQFSVVVVCLSFGDPKIDCLLQAAGKCLFFPIGPDPTYTYCSPINLLLRLRCVLFPTTQNEALIFTTNRPSYHTNSHKCQLSHINTFHLPPPRSSITICHSNRSKHRQLMSNIKNKSTLTVQIL